MPYFIGMILSKKNIAKSGRLGKKRYKGGGRPIKGVSMGISNLLHTIDYISFF